MRIINIIVGQDEYGEPVTLPLWGLAKSVKDASCVVDASGWKGYSYTIEADDQVNDPLLFTPPELNPSKKEPHTVYMLGVFLQLN